MRKFVFAVTVAAFVLALFVSLFSGSPQVSAAPVAAPTPQTFNPSRTAANIVTYANAKTVTADTRWCADLRNYNGMDLQYVIDQDTDVNTTTLKLQFSIDKVNFVDSAQTVVADNAADAAALQRYLLYGRWACIYADVTNSNPIVITAIGVAK